jgi:threonine dehydratase
MPHDAPRITVANIERAAAVIDPVFLHTPQFICEPLASALGVRVALKVETLNPIRSFKGRGADLLVARAAANVPLVTASAGNFGQAMAYACRKRGVELTVFASVTANPFKVQRMRDLGARVVLHGQDFDAAKAEARRVAEQSRVRLVEDGRDVETAEGAGTIGLEWLRFDERLDALLVPLGNGALFNGIARVVKTRSPQTRMIAVQAAAAPAMIESWRAGRAIECDASGTIADGVAVRVPIDEALRDMDGLVDDALLVSEGTILEAMRLVHRHAGVVTEPAGVLGIAALIEHGDAFRRGLAGTILCGGNLTADQMAAWLSASGVQPCYNRATSEGD